MVIDLTLAILSVPLVGGSPTFLLPLRSRHFRSFLAQRLVLRAMCPLNSLLSNFSLLFCALKNLIHSRMFRRCSRVFSCYLATKGLGGTAAHLFLIILLYDLLVAILNCLENYTTYTCRLGKELTHRNGIK